MPLYEIRLAISKPLWGEYYHWGLDFHDEDEDTHHVFEALGEPYSFTASSDGYDPASLPRYWRTIYVAQLADVELENVQVIVDEVLVRNDLTHWNCQDYAIEILDALEKAELLNTTQEYQDVKQALMRMVGPIEDTRRHILAYRTPGYESIEDREHNIDSDADDPDVDDDESSRRVLSEEFVVDSDTEDESEIEG